MMLDFNQFYPEIKDVSFKVLKMIFFQHGMEADDDDLIVAMNIIKNNPYPLVNKEYAPVVLNRIRNATNENMYNCFKQIIEKDYLLKKV